MNMNLIPFQNNKHNTQYWWHVITKMAQFHSNHCIHSIWIHGTGPKTILSI